MQRWDHKGRGGKEIAKCILKIDLDIIHTQKIGMFGFQLHGNKAIAEHCLLCKSQGLAQGRSIRKFHQNQDFLTLSLQAICFATTFRIHCLVNSVGTFALGKFWWLPCCTTSCTPQSGDQQCAHDMSNLTQGGSYWTCSKYSCNWLESGTPFWQPQLIDAVPGSNHSWKSG